VVDGLGQDFVHFRLSKPLFRAWPNLQARGHEVFIALNGSSRENWFGRRLRRRISASFAAMRTSQV